MAIDPTAHIAQTPFSVRRSRMLTRFLWAAVLSWGIGLGAKLFDLLVLASAWGAAPPGSLSLMPYGKAYPINPGDFFQPLSALLLVSSVGALLVGWPWLKAYRRALALPVIMLVVIWILTPTIFWPLISDLWDVSKGRAVLSAVQVAALTHQWFVWDWLRTGLIAVGFIASVHAISAPARHAVIVGAS